MKKIKSYFFSFLIPILLFGASCFITKIYPFGNYLINKFDSVYMYPSIIIALFDKIKEGGNLFYTLNAGLGNNFLGIINLYAGSPFNYLFLLFKNNQIYLFYMLLIFIKIGLSGISMFTYLNYNYKNKNKENLLFAVIYSMSTFLIVYCYHIMWSDAFYLLPLVLLGLDRLINNNKTTFYTIILAITIIINYYIGYMICLFSLLYFIYRIVNLEGQKKKIIINFIIHSLIAGLLGAFVLIPSAFAILNGRNVGSNNYFKLNIYNLFSLFYNLTPGSFLKTDNFNDGTCVIGATVLVLSLVILYFFNKKFSLKEKISTGIFIFIFILSFSFNLFDYTWNMFAKPVWWNCRYAYLFSTLLVLIAHKNFINIDKIKVKKIYQAVILLSTIIILLGSFSYKLIGTQPSNKYIILLFFSNLIFLIYFYTLLNLHDGNRKHLKYGILIILFLSEIMFNNIYLLSVNDKVKYSDTSKKMSETNKLVKSIKNKDDFYRIYDFDDSQENNGLIFNYYSPQLFSSVYNKKANGLYSKYFEVNDYKDETINHTKIDYPTLELLSLINVKFLLNKNNSVFNEVSKNIDFNQYALKPFILLNNNSSIHLKDYDKFNNAKKVYSYLSDSKANFYKKINAKYSYKNVKILNNKIKLINKKKKGYISLEYKIKDEVILEPYVLEYFNKYATIYINNKKINYNNLVKVQKDDSLKIIYKFKKDDFINNKNINKLNMKLLLLEKFNDTLQKINYPDYQIIKDNNILSLKVQVNENHQKLFITIPYDEGLIVKVDGEEVKKTKEFDSFFSIPITKGNHTVTINYFPKGLKTGLLISLITLICYIILKKYLHLLS